MPSARIPMGSAVALLLALIALPLAMFVPAFTLNQLTIAASLGIAIVGLNVVTGLAGQASLAQGAFFAVGAYAAGLVQMAWAAPVPIAPIAGALLASVLGLLTGLPAIRLRGHYLAVVTLGLSVAIVPIANRWSSLTGGGAGLNIGSVPIPSFIAAGADQYLFVWASGIIAIVIFAASRMAATPLGIAMAATRENQVAAAAMGVDMRTVKIGAFGASAFLGGLGGGIYALSTGFVAPENFTPTLSLMLLVGAVIGGIRSIPSAIVGALFIQFVPQFTAAVDKHLAGVLFGLAIVLLIRFFPDGPIEGLANFALRRVANSDARKTP